MGYYLLQICAATNENKRTIKQWYWNPTSVPIRGWFTLDFWNMNMMSGPVWSLQKCSSGSISSRRAFLRKLSSLRDSSPNPSSLHGRSIASCIPSQLWSDTRDSLKCYTLWGVIVFGTLSVFLAVISLAVGIAQAVASREALKLAPWSVGERIENAPIGLWGDAQGYQKAICPLELDVQSCYKQSCKYPFDEFDSALNECINKSARCFDLHQKKECLTSLNRQFGTAVKVSSFGTKFHGRGCGLKIEKFTEFLRSTSNRNIHKLTSPKLLTSVTYLHRGYTNPVIVVANYSAQMNTS